MVTISEAKEWMPDPGGTLRNFWALAFPLNHRSCSRQLILFRLQTCVASNWRLVIELLFHQGNPTTFIIDFGDMAFETTCSREVFELRPSNANDW